MINKKQLLEEFEKLSNELGQNIVSCKDCIDCKYCEYCTDCTNCSSCTFCIDCRYCIDCRMCVICEYCEYCINCFDCFLCSGLKNKKDGFYVLNKKVSEAEYKAAIAEFKGDSNAK